MIDKLKEMASSKKFIAMVGGLATVLVAKVGLDVPNETVMEMTGIVMCYLVGQGIADNGKEAAKVSGSSNNAE